MLDNWPLLSFITFAPLLGVLVLLFVPAGKARIIKSVAITTTFIPLILSAMLYGGFEHETKGIQFQEQADWISIPLNNEVLNGIESLSFQIQYDLAVDGLSLPLIFLTALIASMAALAALHIKKRWKTFYILFLILETGMFGVFLAQDILLFFLFFEVTLVPMFFLIGIWGYMNREHAANKFLIYNGIGSAVMLIAFLILITTAGLSIVETATGTNLFYSGDIHLIMQNLADMNAPVNQTFEGNPAFMDDALKWAVFIMLLIAFGIKLPIFPFHTWMLKVHTEAPPAIVMIHSGILLKMGAYGLIRFGIFVFPEQANAWAGVLAVLGVINILYGAILAFRQKEFKLVLAYSSISHMGIVLLGIAALNTIGMEGAVFQLVSHGLISALMFLIVGTIYERTGTTELDKLGGLAKSLPFTSGILLLAGLASLGLPGLSGFISEFLALLGLFETMPVLGIVGSIGIILAAVYVLRAILRITFGKIQEAHLSLRDARFAEAIPMITLSAFIVLLGVYPAAISNPLHQTILEFHQILQSLMRMGG